MKSPKRSVQVTKSPIKVNESNSWFESLRHNLIRFNIPESLNHESIQIKFLKSFFESWVDVNQSILEPFLSHQLIWIKFQKSILSCELIWINSCKAIESHELIPIKTFWDWVESNKKMSRTHVCCSTADNGSGRIHRFLTRCRASVTLVGLSTLVFTNF